MLRSKKCQELETSSSTLLHSGSTLGTVERMSTIDELHTATANLAACDTERDNLMAERDRLVIRAFEEKVKWDDLEAIPGLTRNNLRRIRDRHGIPPRTSRAPAES